MIQLPSHAGRLRPLERCVFVLVFSLMASFVVIMPFLANTPRGHLLLSGPSVANRTVANGLSPPRTGLGQLAARPRASHAGHYDRVRVSAGPDVQLNDAELATALQPVVGADPGQLAVGAIDLTTGASATYESGASIRGGGLVTADILAALLQQHEQAGTPVTAREAGLAAEMMETGNAAATAQLWTIIGGAPGLAAANARLRLRDTASMACGDGSWMWTRTTIADQLQLLADLAGRKSPLQPAAQDYALGLMASTPAQRWDVRAAATQGTPGAAADGSLVGPRWVVGSIGVIQRHDHEVLVAVLSDRNPAHGSAVAAARAAARTAADLVG